MPCPDSHVASSSSSSSSSSIVVMTGKNDKVLVRSLECLLSTVPGAEWPKLGRPMGRTRGCQSATGATSCGGLIPCAQVGASSVPCGWLCTDARAPWQHARCTMSSDAPCGCRCHSPWQHPGPTAAAPGGACSSGPPTTSPQAAPSAGTPWAPPPTAAAWTWWTWWNASWIVRPPTCSSVADWASSPASRLPAWQYRASPGHTVQLHDTAWGTLHGLGAVGGAWWQAVQWLVSKWQTWWASRNAAHDGWTGLACAGRSLQEGVAGDSAAWESMGDAEGKGDARGARVKHVRAAVRWPALYRRSAQERTAKVCRQSGTGMSHPGSTYSEVLSVLGARFLALPMPGHVQAHLAVSLRAPAAASRQMHRPPSI